MISSEEAESTVAVADGRESTLREQVQQAWTLHYNEWFCTANPATCAAHVSCPDGMSRAGADGKTAGLGVCGRVHERGWTYICVHEQVAERFSPCSYPYMPAGMPVLT